MFTIKKVGIRAYWDIETFNKNCPICTRPLIQLDDNDEIAAGKCGHAFHLNCINKWISRKNTCCVCNQRWVFKKKDN